MIDKNNEIISLAKTLTQIEDYSEILRIANHKLFEWMNSDVALVTVLNPETHNTIKTIGREDIFKRSQRKYHYINNVLSGWVIKNKKTLLSNDLKNEEILRLFNKDKIPFKSALCTPIVLGNRIIGTILLMMNGVNQQYNSGDQDFLERFSAIISPFIYDYQNISEYFTCSLSEQNLLAKYAKVGLIGKSEEFVSMLKSIETASKCDAYVLLEGETGTGKELIAKAIHNFGLRNNRKFVIMDCSSIQSHLIESEIFGHVKGAFTGAITERKGLIEEADHGTLFIDEINLLSLDLQAKLLRLIQEKEFRRVGSNELRKVDTRIIAATSSSLFDMVNLNKFRPELYYRLNIFPIIIPTLNDRIRDIPLLAKYFINSKSKQYSKMVESFDENIMLLLNNRKWAGNLRELENFIERLIIIADDKTNIISEKLLPDPYKSELRRIKKSESFDLEIHSLDESIRNYEEIVIRNALVKYNWNQTKTAESLDLKEQTLRYKMNKYGIIKSK